LTTGEIAVLLPDTPEDRAVRVADRLVQSFHREGADPSDRVVSIGIAWTGSAGSASLVDEARQRAAAAGPRL
jgi:GGDEF domain-containing protein